MSYIFSANCTTKFTPLKGQVYPKLQDFWSVVPLTLAAFILRYTFERFCFKPLGKWLNVREASKRQVPYNGTLEAAYKKNYKDVTVLSKQLDMSKRQVERWWRLRRSQDKPSEMVKFTEDMSRGSFDLFQLILGLYILWDKEWFWDFDKIDKDVHVGITTDIWWYYMISSACFWSLTISQFWDVRRKDFWQMVAHHFVAVALLTFSWLANIYRMGSIILVTHSTDCMLHYVKTAKTAGCRGVLFTLMFACFVVFWIASRLIIFPYWLLRKGIIQAIACNDPVIYLLNVLLWILMTMHLMWSWLLYQVVRKAVVSGQAPDDVRSSSSGSEELDSDVKKLN